MGNIIVGGLTEAGRELWYIFTHWGWLPFGILLIAIINDRFLAMRQRDFLRKLEPVLLRIAVPEDNARSPKAMEQVFASLWALYKPPDLIERFMDGYVQPWFSCEVVGREGKVEFYMWVPKAFRDMAMANIYASYPDASIEETEDYTKPYQPQGIERDFDLTGTEMILLKPDPYPLRTYLHFGEEFTEEERMIDPMATFTETLATMGTGEEMWVQILCRPTIGETWQAEGEEEVKKLMGQAEERKPSLLGKVASNVGAWTSEALRALAGPSEEVSREGGEEERRDLGALALTPGELNIVRAIQENIAKSGFEVKIRSLYVARKEVYSGAKTSLLYSLFNPFNSRNLNALIPDKRARVGFPKYVLRGHRRYQRKVALLRKYRQRAFAEKGFVLNTEELATIFHFPVAYVRTPTLEHVRTRLGEAPANVPFAPR
jgi:hypothetical protein